MDQVYNNWLSYKIKRFILQKHRNNKFTFAHLIYPLNPPSGGIKYPDKLLKPPNWGDGGLMKEPDDDAA
ncbi:MAG: hypothetical protein A2V46_11985 [Bacteroidetes bacterium RBG_19FT_COMBO_42_7]|nr:MAG: hypothetical protein A2V46_11985 [Bacteroidetes bacterium RBG_19FT_COMBO_42_7]